MKKALPIIQSQIKDNVKVIIPDNVMDKIHYLCTVIATLEWSGVLFYTVEGSIKKPSEMVIMIKDILPMDKGTATSTEFTYDERYVQFLMNNEERMEYKSGLIHSHNNMAVFYSGTDQDELKANSKSHNFYLSVVVNNKMEIIGRIGISALAEAIVKTSYKGLDEDGESYEIEAASLRVKNEKLFYLDCDMIYEKPTSAIEDEFLDNVSTILKPKVSTYTKPTVTPIIPSYYDRIDYNDLYDGYDWGTKNPTTQKKGTLPATKFSTSTTPVKMTPKTRNRGFKTQESFETHLETESRIFLLKCFGFYNEEEDEVTLLDIYEGIQEDLDAEQLTIPEIIEDFAFGFNTSYEEHFYNTVYGTEIIMNAIEQALEEESDKFSFLKELKNVIRKI